MNFQQLRTEAENHFNAMGLSSDLVEKYHAAVASRIGAFASELIARAAAQAAYDVTTNFPTGVKTIKDTEEMEYEGEVCDQTAISAIVSALGKFLDWDILRTRQFCADLLGDVNDHDEAALMSEKAKA